MKKYENAARDEKQLQSSSNSDVAALAQPGLSRGRCGDQRQKGGSVNRPLMIWSGSPNHLSGLVICRITKYQPDKSPPAWSSLGLQLGHLQSCVCVYLPAHVHIVHSLLFLFRSTQPSDYFEPVMWTWLVNA